MREAVPEQDQIRSSVWSLELSTGILLAGMYIPYLMLTVSPERRTLCLVCVFTYLFTSSFWY